MRPRTCPECGKPATDPDMLAALRAILAALSQNKTYPADIELARINARWAIKRAQAVTP